MRPPGPLPVTVARSTPRSRASLRTAGAAFGRPAGGPAGGATAACVPDGGRSRRWSRRRGHRGRRGRGVLQDHEDLADLHDVAGTEGQGHHLTGHRGGELDQSLVGLNLHQGLIPGHGVAWTDQPGDDLALLQTLPHVGENELDAAH